MKKRLLKCLCTALLLPALLTGCWQEEPSAHDDILPQPGGPEQEAAETRMILPEIFALPYAPDQPLDPITCPDGMQQVVASLLYEGLFRLDLHLEPEAWLCSGYTCDDTMSRYEFTLRSGVTFSDGSPLTAADVKAALDRARNSERYRARLSDISSVSVSGETVVVSLSKPNSALPALLDIPIVKAGSDHPDAPIGTGPYLFSAGDSGTYLVANQSWWQGTRQPTDRIALVEAADLDTKLYRFTSHDVQLVTADLTGMSPISATGNIVYQDADTTILQYVGCNVTREPLDNAAFRRALSQGINRSSVVSAFLSGHGTPAQFPVSPVSPLYPSELETRYSRDTFSSALAESGIVSDRPLTLLVNTENSFKVSVANYLAESFTADGVPVTVRALPWEEYTAALLSGDFDLYYGEVKLTADWDLSDLLATGGALNYGGWADPRTDQLLEAFAAASDRTAAAKSLCAYLQAQSPILPVCFKSISVLMQAGVVEGLTPTMAEPFYDLTGCTIHLRES
ncbi:ABC transporter substrate-binding protein [uncultured Dysosmobacter sp.]|uniref:ABC transporter substrate-binding protein n=1 Tax=uncultured Dysosmobacter sp. TaxID=2591384 RepID=UPI002602534F|nr:ABC transporter substrate-binding protein [uncultured Dysosmobacter sp.]